MMEAMINCGFICRAMLTIYQLTSVAVSKETITKSQWTKSSVTLVSSSGKCVEVI